MIRQCHACGNCGEHYKLTFHGWECPGCTVDRTEFDADELGLDPESDNTPESPERAA